MPTAFVTGGTGFVGAHTARALVAHGWEVRLLARRPDAARSGLLEGVAVDVVPGDLSSAGLPSGALSGVDAVVHVGGLTKARSLDDYREVNARGTERLVQAAARASPDALFVLVSSQAAAGPARGGVPVTERDAPRPVSWYGVSKREGEEAVERLWPGPWHVLRPGVVYGPGDRGLFQYFQMAARGIVPIPAGRSRVQVIAVERAALALARAAGRRDLARRTSFLCDPAPVALEELARLVGALPARRPRFVAVPDIGVRALGALESGLELLTRRSRPFNADKARELLAGDWLCDGGPLAAALELPPPVPLAEGLRATWDWYRSVGWIPGNRL